MDNDAVALMRALDFSARKHVHQRRKGEAAEPYVNHLAEVARLLAEATGGEDVTLVLGGLLHDVIEDTATTPDELRAAFGDEVTALVLEVTDDKALPKTQRKRLQVETTPGKSARARMLKLADKTSNLRAMVASPPAEWPRRRRADYVSWAKQVANGCRGVNAPLEGWFAEAHAAALAETGEPGAA